MRIGNVREISHFWLYTFTVVLLLPSFLFAEVPATNINNKKVTELISDATPHQGSIVKPDQVRGAFADEQEEYDDHEKSLENEVITYGIIENEDGDRFLVLHPADKRAAHSSFGNMLRLDKKSNYNPSFNSMLRLDKKANYDFNNMLRLDKKAIINDHQNFANMLRLDKRSLYEDNLLRLDKKFANLLRLDKRAQYAYSPNYPRLFKKSHYNPSFNSMLRLDRRSPYKNQNFANMLRLDKKASNYMPSFASNMLRLDKKANYKPGFNRMLRLDKKYSPQNVNAYANQLRLDKKSFKSSLRNFGLLRLD